MTSTTLADTGVSGRRSRLVGLAPIRHAVPPTSARWGAMRSRCGSVTQVWHSAGFDLDHPRACPNCARKIRADLDEKTAEEILGEVFP